MAEAAYRLRKDQHWSFYGGGNWVNETCSALAILWWRQLARKEK